MFPLTLYEIENKEIIYYIYKVFITYTTPI
jgi:hypothetical protein